MSSPKFFHQNINIREYFITEKEIGEILVDLRGICKDENLSRTSDAVKSALFIFYYETRVKSGAFKIE